MTSSASTPPQYAMDDPDHGWKPNNRPQSTVARNFMSELDDLFRLDSGIDNLEKTVHQKKQAVTTHAQELEALEAKLRETEARLKQAKTSPPRNNDGQRTENNMRAESTGSPMARRQKENLVPQSTEHMPDRPLTAQTNDGKNA